MSDDALIAEALIGEEAEKFKESDLGRCLLGMAEQERMAAQDALSSVDPNDPKSIRQLQNQIWLADRFSSWIDELIVRGREATTTWQKQREEPDNG